MIILTQGKNIFVVNNTGEGITMAECIRLAFRNEMERREMAMLDDIPEDEPGSVPDDLLKQVGAYRRHVARIETGWNSLWTALLPQLVRNPPTTQASELGTTAQTTIKRGSVAWQQRVHEIRDAMYDMAGGCQYACEYVDDLLRVYLDYDV